MAVLRYAGHQIERFQNCDSLDHGGHYPTTEFVKNKAGLHIYM